MFYCTLLYFTRRYLDAVVHAKDYEELASENVKIEHAIAAWVNSTLGRKLGLFVLKPCFNHRSVIAVLKLFPPC